VRVHGAIWAGCGSRHVVWHRARRGELLEKPSDLRSRTHELVYETEAGRAYSGDSLDVLPAEVVSDSVDLIVTSPPFALQRPKEYGNAPQEEYLAWFMGFADEFWRVLKPSGSLVLDLGGAWETGVPVKSLYAFELLIALCRRHKRPFYLAQDFYWYNPARLPSPASWVTVNRIRAKDAVNYVWWLSKSTNPKANNERVVTDYSPKMKQLLKNKRYNRGSRPSGHVVREGFTRDRGGAIPPNMLSISNTGSDMSYIQACKASGLKVHPARFPPDLPKFFIDFLTDPDDLVLDPFSGSNITGQMAQAAGRKWLAIDSDREYVQGSAVRFDNLQHEIVTADQHGG
jgi:DNA modification methylase